MNKLLVFDETIMGYIPHKNIYENLYPIKRTKKISLKIRQLFHTFFYDSSLNNFNNNL